MTDISDAWEEHEPRRRRSRRGSLMSRSNQRSAPASRNNDGTFEYVTPALSYSIDPVAPLVLNNDQNGDFLRSLRGEAENNLRQFLEVDSDILPPTPSPLPANLLPQAPPAQTFAEYNPEYQNDVVDEMTHNHPAHRMPTERELGRVNEVLRSNGGWLKKLALIGIIGLGVKGCILMNTINNHYETENSAQKIVAEQVVEKPVEPKEAYTGPGTAKDMHAFNERRWAELGKKKDLEQEVAKTIVGIVMQEASGRTMYGETNKEKNYVSQQRVESYKDQQVNSRVQTTNTASIIIKSKSQPIKPVTKAFTTPALSKRERYKIAREDAATVQKFFRYFDDAELLFLYDTRNDVLKSYYVEEKNVRQPFAFRVKNFWESRKLGVKSYFSPDGIFPIIKRDGEKHIRLGHPLVDYSGVEYVPVTKNGRPDAIFGDCLIDGGVREHIRRLLQEHPGDTYFARTGGKSLDKILREYKKGAKHYRVGGKRADIDDVLRYATRE